MVETAVRFYTPNGVMHFSPRATSPPHYPSPPPPPPSGHPTPSISPPPPLLPTISSPSKRQKTTAKMSEHRAGLVTGLANLLRTGEFSDLEILCGDRHFSVHKNVICCQSMPLKAMCTNGMKESQESVIDLTIDTEPCVSRLVDFFYRCDYDELGDDCEDASTDDEDTAANNDNVAQWNLGSGKDDAGTYSNDASSDDFLPVPLIVTPRQLSLHIDMYVLADKYDVSSLAELAKKKFETMAEQSRPLHRKECFFPALETVPRIYAVTSEHNRGLRDVVVEYTRLQRTKSNNRDSFMFTDKVEELFESVPEFAADVLQSWLKMPYLGYCEEQDCGRILRDRTSFAGRVASVGATRTDLELEIRHPNPFGPPWNEGNERLGTG